MESASIWPSDWTSGVRAITNMGKSPRVCKFSNQMTHLDAKSIRENNWDEVILKANWLRFDGPWSGEVVARRDRRQDPSAEVAGSIFTLCIIQWTSFHDLNYVWPKPPRRSALPNDACWLSLCFMQRVPDLHVSSPFPRTTLIRRTRFVSGTRSECNQPVRLLRLPRFDNFAITNCAHAILMRSMRE